MLSFFYTSNFTKTQCKISFQDFLFNKFIRAIVYSFICIRFFYIQSNIELLHKSAKEGDLKTISKISSEKRYAYGKVLKHFSLLKLNLRSLQEVRIFRWWIIAMKIQDHPSKTKENIRICFIAIYLISSWIYFILTIFKCVVIHSA